MNPFRNHTGRCYKHKVNFKFVMNRFGKHTGKCYKHEASVKLTWNKVQMKNTHCLYTRMVKHRASSSTDNLICDYFRERASFTIWVLCVCVNATMWQLNVYLECNFLKRMIYVLRKASRFLKNISIWGITCYEWPSWVNCVGLVQTLQKFSMVFREKRPPLGARSTIYMSRTSRRILTFVGLAIRTRKLFGGASRSTSYP